MDFFLSVVNYEQFWNKIKLVGYTMQLRPEHMRMISPSLGLDYETDLLGPEKTDAKFLLQDEKFGYSSGIYEPTKLLILGFMYCQYNSLGEHMESLWPLINPNFKPKVSMRVVKFTLEDLLHVAIDQRLHMIEMDANGD